MTMKYRSYITGGNGLLGTELHAHLTDLGHAVIAKKSAELNLMDKNAVMSEFCSLELSNSQGSFSKIDTLFHLAAHVGGVQANMQNPSTFFANNIAINTNVLDAAVYTNIPRVVSVLSTCVYPDKDYVTYPLTEEQLHSGPPHSSNYGYAYAKRMLEVQTRALRQQYDKSYVTVIPNNLFGKNDSYSLENGHVIPSLIRKIWEAKLTDAKEVEIWGDGTPLREFTYASDAAKILRVVSEEYDDNMPLNIGNTEEYSIKHVADLIARFLEYKGKFVYNLSKPMGQFRKPSCNKRLLSSTSWRKEYYTPFDQALWETCKWFEKNYPNVRGVGNTLKRKI